MPSAISIGSGMPSPLGVTLRDGGINVAVVSRNAEHIYLCLFDEKGERETYRFALPERLGDIDKRRYLRYIDTCRCQRCP